MTHLRKVGTVKTVNMETGEVLREEKNAFTILPPPDGMCPECATDHAWDQPHNQQSLFYQMRFHSTHGRFPTWTDAMTHCTPEVRQEWRRELVALMKEKGLPVPPDLENVCPTQPGR